MTDTLPPLDLHAAIMNLPCRVPDTLNGSQAYDYKCGHRDARHAAAELVSAALPAAQPTDEEILALAHRTAATYTHRSDPKYHSYGFGQHTLLDFARKLLANHSGVDASRLQPSVRHTPLKG
jgi:hypothetical protein